MSDDAHPPRRPIVSRFLGFTPPVPEGEPLRAIKIIRGDQVMVAMVPPIIRQPERPARPDGLLPCCGGVLHRRRRDKPENG